MTDKNRELVPDSLEPGKRKSADHWTLFGRMLFRTLGCLQKSGDAGKECKGEEVLKGRWETDEK